MCRDAPDSGGCKAQCCCGSFGKAGVGGKQGAALPIVLKNWYFCSFSKKRLLSSPTWKNPSAAKEETYEEKQPPFPPTVLGGHLLPSHHRVIWRACFGSPASVTYGAR